MFYSFIFLSITESKLLVYYFPQSMEFLDLFMDFLDLFMDFSDLLNLELNDTDCKILQRYFK